MAPMSTTHSSKTAGAGGIGDMRQKREMLSCVTSEFGAILPEPYGVSLGLSRWTSMTGTDGVPNGEQASDLPFLATWLK